MDRILRLISNRKAVTNSWQKTMLSSREASELRLLCDCLKFGVKMQCRIKARLNYECSDLPQPLVSKYCITLHLLCKCSLPSLSSMKQSV